MNSYKYITRRYQVDSKAVSPIVLGYDRFDLAKLFRELKFKRGAEIGVEKGMYSKVLCEENPDAEIYGIDSWKDYKEYTEDHTKHYYDKQYFFTKRRMESFNNYKIIEKLSMEAVKDFALSSLDFVYIDANHSFDYVMEDITEWSKIVRKGGIISGHDYKDTKMMHLGVIRAVNLYVKEHNKILFLLTDSSWFFVN